MSSDHDTNDTPGTISPDQASNLWQRLLGGHREEIKPENNLWAHFLPEGCRRCLLGGRLCLTIGERCHKDCFYCSNPMGTDLIRADEFTINSDEDLLRLVRFSDPDAVCLTGGEPTLYMDRAEHYARLLREECGPDFHIQFFTANAEMTEDQMARMHGAGVDEIRCHLASYKEAHLVERARGYDWTVAVEIPSLPIADITDRIVDKAIELGAEFVNLHELLYFDHEDFQRVAKRTNLQPGEPLSRKIPFEAAAGEGLRHRHPGPLRHHPAHHPGQQGKSPGNDAQDPGDPGQQDRGPLLQHGQQVSDPDPQPAGPQGAPAQAALRGYLPGRHPGLGDHPHPGRADHGPGPGTAGHPVPVEGDKVEQGDNLLMVPWTVALKKERVRRTGRTSWRSASTNDTRFPVTRR